mmetsp:Transcript_11657/g.19758  ORF Transcript_11657/g.19758 Transcript_11657/m.19758 type:complete len:221 (-) Transcript_11657:34-696(-)
MRTIKVRFLGRSVAACVLNTRDAFLSLLIDSQLQYVVNIIIYSPSQYSNGVGVVVPGNIDIGLEGLAVPGCGQSSLSVKDLGGSEVGLGLLLCHTALSFRYKVIYHVNLGSRSVQKDPNAMLPGRLWIDPAFPYNLVTRGNRREPPIMTGVIFKVRTHHFPQLIAKSNLFLHFLDLVIHRFLQALHHLIHCFFAIAVVLYINQCIGSAMIEGIGGFISSG